MPQIGLAQMTPVTVVLSYGLWLREFGGDRAVLSREIRLNDSTYSIIGAMPQDFYFPSRETALWLPMQLGSQDFEIGTTTTFRP